MPVRLRGPPFLGRGPMVHKFAIIRWLLCAVSHLATSLMGRATFKTGPAEAHLSRTIPHGVGYG